MIQPYSGTFENRLERQANIYRDMFEVCLNAEPCTSFVLWGFTDKHTWLHDFRDPDEQPLLFDELYQPKPAYEALVELMTDF